MNKKRLMMEMWFLIGIIFVFVGGEPLVTDLLHNSFNTDTSIIQEIGFTVVGAFFMVLGAMNA